MIDADFDIAFRAGLDQILFKDIALVDSFAVPFAASVLLLFAIVDKMQLRVTTQLGDQVQVALPHHLEDVVVTEVSIQRQMTNLNPVLEPGEQFLDHFLDAFQLFGQFHLGFVPVLAAFGSARLSPLPSAPPAPLAADKIASQAHPPTPA